MEQIGVFLEGTGVLWLGVLWLLWTGLLLGGYLFGKPHRRTGRRMPTWTRIGSSITLTLAAWFTLFLLRDAAYAGIVLLVAIGMSLGLVGDLFMTGILSTRGRNQADTIGGMVAFALGHVAYIAAFLTLASRFGLTHTPSLLGAWLLWLIFAFVIWRQIVTPEGKRDALQWAALPYSLLVASTAGVSSGLALQALILLPSALGGALFFFSDLLIANRIFRHANNPLLDDAIWLTYGPAQMLLVYATCAALIVLASMP
ncbi:MAG: lysoplasmalogenase [Anaerolineae bacterium]